GDELRLAFAGDIRGLRGQEQLEGVGVVAKGRAVFEFVAFEAEADTGDDAELRLEDPQLIRIVDVERPRTPEPEVEALRRVDGVFQDQCRDTRPVNVRAAAVVGRSIGGFGYQFRDLGYGRQGGSE